MTRSLIEQWFPAATVGAESIRERSAFTALPAPFALHVWWARRPLITSRAAIVLSLLPAWPSNDEGDQDASSQVVLEALRTQFPEGERSYHLWVVKLLAIGGDPVAARAAIDAAVAAGSKTSGNAYGYPRAFGSSPAGPALQLFHQLSGLGGGVGRPPVVLDPFAGGGSIPFESTRLGCQTIANELNPVAAAVIEGTVDLPAQLGTGFTATISTWGRVWAERVRHRLETYFPQQSRGERNAYIWAHTVPCPSTGRPTPLCPNLSLSTGATGAAVRLLPDTQSGEISTEIVTGSDAKEAGRQATYSRGSGVSVWDPNTTFDGEYVRRCATSGEMGFLLLAVSVTTSNTRGRSFRPPSRADRDAVTAAAVEVGRLLPEWEVRGLVPTEFLDAGAKTEEPRKMGITRWRDFFTPRQLLTAVTYLEVLHDVLHEARDQLSNDEWLGLSLYLSFTLDKSVDYNSRQATWERTTQRVKHSFARHDFAFRWTFAELDGAASLLPWALAQTEDTYLGTARLLSDQDSLSDQPADRDVRIMRGSASALDLPDASVDVVVTDPPYYDNVMYGECSDYFYVWLKRSLRESWPQFCDLVLSDKQNEAVANKSLFRDIADPGARGRREGDGMSAMELADQRYEELLKASFVEAHRVLKDDGVMTVMFTHKRVDAWDTLGAALLDAGFEISSSWPVHTESEHSLHQAKKNSASSTILLGCRKRASTEPAYWQDIRADVERAAEEAARRFAGQGIRGVDLTLASYGPALSVLSRNWPVYTGNLDERGEREIIRPDVALDLARARVSDLKKRELLGGRSVEFDRATDWWLLAWTDFQAAEFPAGEALKLCIALDLDLDEVAKGHKLVKATAGTVTLLTPAQRRTAKGLDPDAVQWSTVVDALHALMLVLDEDGLQAAERWLSRTGRKDDERFAAMVEAAIHAIPRARDKDGSFVRPEARVLETLRATLFDQIEAPDVLATTQTSLFDEV